ncbi:MAG: hypothetical protein ABR898_07015 [Terracidiphilus sp.]|jgi:hypothetical protein
MGIFLVIAGGLGIAGGILGKDFYAADVDTLSPFKQKSSRWSGRLVFLLTGAVLVAIGVKLLVGAE